MFGKRLNDYHSSSFLLWNTKERVRQNKGFFCFHIWTCAIATKNQPTVAWFCLSLFLCSGPSEWHKEFPIAKEGKRQSPIDIVTENVVEAHYNIFEHPLHWEYTTRHCLNVENLGTSWQVNLDGTGSSKLVSMQPNCFNAFFN